MPYPGHVAQSDIDTLLTRTEETIDHIHAIAKSAPDLSGSIALAANGSAWTLGAASATILDATGLTYDIHWIDIYAMDTNAEYQINLYCSTYGGGSTAIASLTCSKSAVTADRYGRLPVITPLLTGGLITAKLADSVGTATCSIKIGYHVY